MQRPVSNVRAFIPRIPLSLTRSKFRRRLIVQHGVQAALIIILTPFTDGSPDIISAFIAKASVKTFNKSILCRLAGLDKMELHQ